MYRILLVDDEEFVLAALRRELLSRPYIGYDGLEIEAFSLPEKALERTHEKEGYFDAVITDYRMPGMNGVEFLNLFSKIHPDTVRIILSGYADKKNLVGAINVAHIDFFIPKPWQSYELKRVLLQALKRHDLQQENRRLAEMYLRDTGSMHNLIHKDTYQVIVVDDDPNVLKALERELDKTFTQGCFGLYKLEVHSFDRTEPALLEAHERQFDVVISDYAMPFASGIEFLRMFRDVQPDAVRILISGKADVDVLVEAVNVAGISHFIGKPWHDYELRSAIDQALSHRELELDNRILAGLMKLRAGH